MRLKRILPIMILFLGIGLNMNAQRVLDEVVAVVGNEVILLSDVEAQMASYKDLSAPKLANLRCTIVDQLLQKKLLLTRARIDSLKINDEQVENEMNRRMAFFVNQYGSEEAIEKFYHKSILEIKGDFRDAVKEQLLEEQMQNKVVNEVEPTPEEIKKFYSGIPKDSLPYFNTELEIGQILMFPKPSKAERQKTIDKLREIRRLIVTGQKTFKTEAILNSVDMGSALHGGELGMQPAENFVQEFAAGALALKKDSISDVIETKFGFHIIQLIERKGDKINPRHILMRPEISMEAINKVKSTLDSLKKEAEKGKKDSLFSVFSYQYSQDNDTKNRGGMMIDQKTNSSHIPINELDAVTFDAIDKLKVGELSAPLYFKSPDGQEGYRVLYIKSKNAPHKANLKDDYPKIKQLAQEDKKSRALDKWIKKFIPLTYVRVNTTYNTCKILDKWQNSKLTTIK